MKSKFLFIIALILLISPLWAQKKQKPNTDYLGVAAVLIRDGNYQRARKALEQVDLEDDKTDVTRYYTLLGLVQLRGAEYSQAVKSFKQALDQGQPDTVIYAYMAQGYFAQGLYEETIQSIDLLPNLNQFPDLYGMKSQAYWQIKDVGNAFAILEKGISRFPQKTGFLQQKIIYLLEMELNQEAADISREYLAIAGKEDPEAYIIIGQALSKAGELPLAIEVFEIARLKFPQNQRIRLSLAQVYIEKGFFRTAAGLVEEASIYDPQFRTQGVELYRKAGNLEKAAFLNSLVADPKEKTRQRFSILLEGSRFEEARALESRMERHGLFEEDSYLYAMAYVLFELQKYEDAVRYLNRIQKADFFRQATQLRQAIEIMKNDKLRFF